MEKNGAVCSRQKSLLYASFLMFCLFATVTEARGDVTVVSRSTVEFSRRLYDFRPKTKPEFHIRTTYYKGAKIRVESEKGAVVLYDTKTGKIYVLDSTQKTFTVYSLKRDAAALLEYQKTDSKSTLTLKPGYKNRVISGKRASNYLFVEIESRGIKPSAVRKGNAIDEGSLLPSGPKVLISNNQGEVWLTNQVNLTGIAATSLPSLASYVVESDISLTKPLADRLARLHGCLLFSKTVRTSAPVEQLSTDVPLYPTTYTYEVISLKETPLPDKLFAIPKKYKQVKKKLTFGGGPGG